MLFLKIYIGFSILTFILVMMQSYISSKELKREYPDIQAHKRSALEGIFICIKAFITCFIPIINIAICYVQLFESEKIKERVLNGYKDAIKE